VSALLPTAAAAETIGLSVAQFNRITRGMTPDGTYVNPHSRSGPPGKLWSRRTLVALKRRKAVVAARDRKLADAKALMRLALSGQGAEQEQTDVEYVEVTVIEEPAAEDYVVEVTVIEEPAAEDYVVEVTAIEERAFDRVTGGGR
jgi:hypothetical protein